MISRYLPVVAHLLGSVGRPGLIVRVLRGLALIDRPLASAQHYLDDRSGCCNGLGVSSGCDLMNTMTMLDASVMAEAVGKRHGAALESSRDRIAQSLAAGSGLSVERRQASLLYPSLVDLNVDVRVAMAARSAQNFSSLDADTWLVTVALRCTVGTGIGTSHPQPVEGSELELEGWARAALGPAWSDYAYRVTKYATPTKASFFHVLLDNGSSPRLAPTDFDWVLSGPGGLVESHKLQPRRTERQLIGYLRRYGDLKNSSADTSDG